jgi:hypothetical protein
MSAIAIAIVVGALIFFIITMIILPPLGYTILGIILTLAILAVVLCCWRKIRDRSPTSLLPTSVQQAGDASDIRSAPDANAPAFTCDHDGRRESVVLRPPPPAVMRDIDNRGSYLRPVTHLESPMLLPKYMDGTDG